MILALFYALIGTAYAAPKLPADYLPLPLIRQTTSYDCGPTALLSVLRYWQVYDEDHGGGDADLFPLLATTAKDGTDPPHLVAGARHFSLNAQLHENMAPEELRDALDAGATVILDLQAWRDEKTKRIAWKDDWEDGHYVVLAGMDKKNAYIMDPSTKDSYAWLPVSELLERWRDYEDRNGYIQRYQRSAIVITGAHALPRPPSHPATLERME
jgi:predicted double-glycine peptidase